MRSVVLLVIAVLLTGCGYSSRDNELIGQVKKVVKFTPIICMDYTAVDISLGILRGGVGSMSTQDVWLYVDDRSMEKTLKEANETGALVKIAYDDARWRWCVETKVVRSAKIIK
jgi:hypothetical protein